jgi:hypothetical protein
MRSTYLRGEGIVCYAFTLFTILITHSKTGVLLVMAHMLGILYTQDVCRVPHKRRYLGIDTLVHPPVVEKRLDLSTSC